VTTAPASLAIDVTPARRASLFNADTDDGRVLVRARSTPFYDAARAALRLGLATPNDVLSMRIGGHVALEATAGALAMLGPRHDVRALGVRWVMVRKKNPKHSGARPGSGRPRKDAVPAGIPEDTA
jgi:hypothetical protein